MKVTVKRKNNYSTTYRHPVEDNRWYKNSKKSVGMRNNGRAAIRAVVVPRVTRRGA